MRSLAWGRPIDLPKIFPQDIVTVKFNKHCGIVTVKKCKRKNPYNNPWDSASTKGLNQDDGGGITEWSHNRHDRPTCLAGWDNRAKLLHMRQFLGDWYLKVGLVRLRLPVSQNLNDV